MDIAVIVSGVLSFFLFILIHFLVFRTISHRSVIRGLVLTWILGNFCAILLLMYALSLFAIPMSFSGIFFVVSLLLFNALCLCYILGVFGMMVASLRIRLLWEIYKSGLNGARYSDILKRYNCKIIVDERLARLLNAGEIEKREGAYFLRTKISVFRVHRFLYMLFKKLYTK